LDEETLTALRLWVIAELAKRSQGGMGRMALMKLIYFVQTLRGVPLGYCFRLYTYGPFDAHVLDDLRVAEMCGAVRSKVFSYSGGYGYEIRPGDPASGATFGGLSEPPATGYVVDQSTDEYDSALGWVIEEFGLRSALDLELASTVVYVDQAAAASQSQLSTSELAARVEDIKPRLERSRIETEAESLKAKGLLIATV
jgi:uncharacterized protein